MNKLLYTILLVIILTPAVGQKITREQYIERFRQLAINEMTRTGIPASITLAQGLLESDNGNSKLALKGNNHFGIKCHSSWTGGKMYKHDDKRNECFRKYKSAWESYRDHSNFLINGKRYAFLFELKPADYKGWANGLKKAGYATNPKYPSLLIKIIEDNNLTRYDSKKSTTAKSEKKPTKSKETNKQKPTEKTKQKKKGVNLEDIDNYSINPFGRTVKISNRVKYIVAKESDTYYKISQDMDLMLWQIYKYNDLPKNARIAKGQKIHIQPKRNKAKISVNTHEVVQGETMYTISQRYSIKLKSLYSRNNLTPGNKIKAGDIIQLR